MPAFDLSKGPQTLARYDVIGQHSPDSPPTITHVALYNGDREKISFDQDIDVAHMRPPLQSNDTISAHAAAQIPLDTDEIKIIEVWITKIEDEYSQSGVENNWRSQFWIDPPWKDRLNKKNGVRRYRRYSCAGFVMDSHCQVDINLLQVDKETLPDVTEDMIKSAYDISDIAILRRFGVRGDPPWRIVLAGYVLHALKRESKDIRRGPYQPKPGDEHF